MAVISHPLLLAVLGNLEWLADDTFQPELAWLRGLIADQLARWVVLLPQQTRFTTRRVRRTRTVQRLRTPTHFARRLVQSVDSEERHRNAAMRIAGVETPIPDPEADALRGEATGAIILYPTVERDNLDGSQDEAIAVDKVTIGFHLVTPPSMVPAGGKLMHWMTVDKTNPQALALACRLTCRVR